MLQITQNNTGWCLGVLHVNFIGYSTSGWSGIKMLKGLIIWDITQWITPNMRNGPVSSS